MMDEKNSLSQIEKQKLSLAKELSDCNRYSASFGLTLLDNQIANLVKKREHALLNTGRVEFGEGILTKLVYAFCDSPYLLQEDYEFTLAELQDSFYYFKNESMDLIPDDDIIEFMKEYFDGECHGSVEALSDTTLEKLCRAARFSELSEKEY